MSLPFASLINEDLFTVLITALISILFFREWRAKKIISRRQELQRQRTYQISILKEIQDRIGYSLNVEEVVDIVTGSLKNLFPYSAASSIVVKEDKLIFKTHIEESVSSGFIGQVKKSMLASISALIPNVPTNIEERVSGVPLDEDNKFELSSFFHIPFIVNNKVVGLINVSSTKPNLYKEEEMTILYQITGQASNALSKLRQVLDTEENKLTSMVGSLADGVFMVDGKNELLIINEAAKKFLNIKKDNVIFTDVLNSMAGKFDLVDKITNSVTSKKSIEEKEVLMGEKTFQIFITPVFNSKESENQTVVGASILIHDITIEKNLSKIKEDFTNMMVHELRAPLTAIKDSSELMLENENVGSDENKQLLHIIDSQTKMLLEQIGSILDAAKIEAGRFVIQKSPNDLNRLIIDVVDAFTPQAKKKGVELNSYVPKTLPDLSFDKIRVNQVLNNLISNSLKFTPSGGKITVLGEINTDSVTVSVTDTGMGISEEDQKDLFSKFYQIRKTPAELAKGGTGLGLYIVKGIVEAHGGFVTVDSTSGQGTTISFTLPIADDVVHEKRAYSSSLPAHFTSIN